MAKKPKTQLDKFRDAARKHEADQDEGKFNDARRALSKSTSTTAKPDSKPMAKVDKK